MKKTVTMILALAAAAALLTGCGAKPQPTTEAVTETTLPATEGTESTEGTTGETVAPVTGPSADALAILETIWADYTEEEKFPIGGGGTDNYVMDAPGALDMTQEQNLSYTLLLPEAEVAKVDGAATMLHMMNSNTFTSGVIHMEEGTDLTALAGQMRDVIKNNPFVCGFPERMLLAVVDSEYLLISFGNGEIMDNFQSHLTAVYPEAEILYTDSII